MKRSEIKNLYREKTGNIEKHMQQGRIGTSHPYNTPEMEIQRLDVSDIIQTSFDDNLHGRALNTTGGWSNKYQKSTSYGNTKLKNNLCMAVIFYNKELKKQRIT